MMFFTPCLMCFWRRPSLPVEFRRFGSGPIVWVLYLVLGGFARNRLLGFALQLS